MVDKLRSTSPRHSRILGIGGYLPRRSVTNAEICERIDSDEEWIESRSGVRTRHFAAEDETLLAMAAAAGGKALAQAGVAPGELDAILVASMSNLVQTPPLAYQLADRLGAVAAGGFDVSGACAGFCHALDAGSALVRLREARHVLVVGAERMSDIVDPTDRNIAFLFADGAGAAVLGPSASPGIGPTVRGADGAYAAALRMTNSWRDFRADPSSVEPMMRMDGRRVFRWVVDVVVPAARRALDAAGVEVRDLAAFVPHQANLRLIEIMADRLGLGSHVMVASSVRTSGNTSAASIPLALERLPRPAPGEPALLIGFGSGLNYAAQVVVLP